MFLRCKIIVIYEFLYEVRPKRLTELILQYIFEQDLLKILLKIRKMDVTHEYMGQERDGIVQRFPQLSSIVSISASRQ